MRQPFGWVRLDQRLTATIVLEVRNVAGIRYGRTRREALFEEQGMRRHSLAGARR